MALPVYPFTLPLPQLQQQLKDKERTLRSPMANGATRARTINTAPETEYQLTFIFNQTQYDGFTGWFYHRLKGIESWFSCQMIRESGTAVERVRFIQEYTEQKINGNQWLITGAIEMKRVTRFDESTAVINIYGQDNLQKFATALLTAKENY